MANYVYLLHIQKADLEKYILQAVFTPGGEVKMAKIDADLGVCDGGFFIGLQGVWASAMREASMWSRDEPHQPICNLSVMHETSDDRKAVCTIDVFGESVAEAWQRFNWIELLYTEDFSKF